MVLFKTQISRMGRVGDREIGSRGRACPCPKRELTAKIIRRKGE